MQDLQTFRKIQAAVKNPSTLNVLSDQDKRALLEWLEHAKYNWELHARPSQVVPAGKWSTWVILAGRGWGKDLRHDTPLLTQNRGWITIGEAVVGDTVFAWDGTPTRVVDVYRPSPRPLVKFTFSDGSSLVSSIEHDWVTWTHRDRKQFNRHNPGTPIPDDWVNWGDSRTSGLGPSVKSTAEIVRTFTYSSRGDNNHSIPVAKPLVYDHGFELSDAYYLGYWLGDGFTDNAGAIALGVEDEEWVLSRWPGGSLRRTSNAYLLPPESKQRKLILSLGLRGAKKLPEIVFSLGFEQRLSVLRGLMDSDGYAEGSRVEFTSTNRGLAYGVLRLARTLGQKPRLVEGRATIYGKDCGPKYRVYWRPAYGVNPFFLPRKANVISFGGKQESRNHHRMIVAWEEVEYEPTVCISVDHEDHLFLAGEALIPTHNTAVGANAVREHVHKFGYSAVGLIAATASDARDTMIDGKGGSSLLEISPPWEGLEYFPTKRKLSWKNGATGHSYSAEEPERLRGPQHDFIWMDELATWRYLQDTWDQASFGLRLGQNPKRIITTTPRPLPLLNEILKDAVPVEVYMADPDKYPGATVLVRGATMENADNLAPQFLEELKRKYEGTRLGRQEIYAEILDDNPNALFRQMKIDENRVEVESGSLRKGSDIKFKYRLSQGAERPQSFKTTLSEFVIAVDPSMSSDTSSDETGILVQAVDEKKSLYVVEDASGIMTPNEWAKRVLMLYQKYGADSIVAEVNQGGDLVENTIRTAEKEMDIGRVNYRKVRASKGKYARAEPVGALEEQGRIHHIGDFPKLEEQLTTFQPGYQSSPDRLDAYVWGAHHLIIQREKKGFFIF